MPLRAVGYFAATALLMVLLGDLVSFLSPPLRFVVVPLAVAVLGTQAAPDGRTAHRFAWDWLRFRLRARRRSAGRVVRLEGEPVRWDGELAVRWDVDGAELHHARVRRAGARDVQRADDARRGGRLGRAVRRDGAGGTAVTRFPLRYAHQNILVGEGDARAALFRVDTVSYPFLAAADKREWLRRLARFAFAVEADFSLLARLPRVSGRAATPSRRWRCSTSAISRPRRGGRT